MTREYEDAPLASKSELGRLLTMVAAGLVLISSLASQGLRVFLGTNFDALVLVVMCAAELSVTAVLYWGLVKGKWWARIIVILRSLFAILIVGDGVGAIPLALALSPSFPSLLMWIPLALAGVLLAFGPGVRAFFAQELELDQKQREYLGGAVERRIDDQAGTDGGSEEREVCRGIRALDEALGSAGIEDFYAGEFGGLAVQIADLLMRIGARESAKTLTEINQLFGKTGPAAEPGERRAALASFSWSQSSAFSRAELELERHGEDYVPLLYAYIREVRGEQDADDDWSSNA